MTRSSKRESKTECGVSLVSCMPIAASTRKSCSGILALFIYLMALQAGFGWYLRSPSRSGVSFCRRTLAIATKQEPTPTYHKLSRIYVPASLISDSRLAIHDEETKHYILNVMRLKSGESLRVFNAVDGEFHAVVESTTQEGRSSKRRMHDELILGLKRQLRVIDQTSTIRIAALIPILKKERLKLLAEKLTELGVDYIVPVISHNTNIPFGEDVVDNKLLTVLQKIIVQGLEQSERLTIPRLYQPIKLHDILSAANTTGSRVDLCIQPFSNDIHTNSSRELLPLTQILICKERSHQCVDTLPIVTRSIQLREALLHPSSFPDTDTTVSSTTKGNDVPPITVAIMVGPEGGFTAQELMDMRILNGFVSLGDTVLRAETAAIVSLGIVSNVLHMHSNS